MPGDGTLIPHPVRREANGAAQNRGGASRDPFTFNPSESSQKMIDTSGPCPFTTSGLTPSKKVANP
jgi:hypothetical protein